MNSNLGKYFILIGSILLIAGILIYFFSDKLNWIGRLPGDVRVERPHFRFYFPITTMILASLGLTAILYLIKKFL